MSDKKNLIETIESTDMFSVFARLMRTSGLNEIIRERGPLTIFVPTNDAFRKVPDHVMNGWTSENGHAMLTTVLSAHIVAERLMAANLGLSSKTAISICGTEMRFTDEKGLRVNDSGVQARNIIATDGIIHALDSVLITDDRPSVSSDLPKIEGDLAPAAPQDRPTPATARTVVRKIAPSPERQWKLS